MKINFIFSCMNPLIQQGWVVCHYVCLITWIRGLIFPRSRLFMIIIFIKRGRVFGSPGFLPIILILSVRFSIHFVSGFDPNLSGLSGFWIPKKAQEPCHQPLKCPLLFYILHLQIISSGHDSGRRPYTSYL